MILSKVKNNLLENYTKIMATEAKEFSLCVDAPAIVCSGCKSERLAHPHIGIIHRSNVYSPLLNSFCAQLNTIHQGISSNLQPKHPLQSNFPYFNPTLLQSLKSLCESLCHLDTEAEIEYTSAVLSYQKTQQCPIFQELNQFIISLSNFLNGHYSKSNKIEPFQKQLILHTFFFIVSIKAPESTNKLFEIFKQYFGLLKMNQEKLHIFKQKASIFLIPRRHGKTWIVVAIISMLLASVEGIHIGYVAHQKHVANSVFTEILNTLYKHFPTKNIQIKKENGTIMYTLPGKKSSTLMCATCFNKNSIRGQTFNLLYIDEANFIKKDSLPSILGFMLQKDAKLIFISSVNSSDQTTSFLYNLKNASEKMLNVVNYVCTQHKEDFNLQDSIVSCPCFRLHIPSYITINESIKNTTNLFLDGTFTTELIGDTTSTSQSSVYRVVSESSLNQFDLCRIDTCVPNINLNSTLYIYVDPAYTNNSEASGTGVGAVVTFKNNKQRAVILGIEHFFLKDLTGAAAMQIANCVSCLVKSIIILHPFITKIYVAVEGNSSQDSAVAISTLINESSSLPAYFVHHSDRLSKVQWPLHILGTEKSGAFESFIYAINSSTISSCQAIVSHTIKLSYDPVSYLIEQIKNIKRYTLKDGTFSYCAKNSTLSDDTLVAVVMAYHFATSCKYTFKRLNIHNSSNTD
ncbi:ORF29 [Felid gammaherpesvirus 1]|uniref:ORF29 n=1 Tax=Felid gammaherpesvirus 1 TaxID=2560468 RepID=A0A0M4LRR8_9GAMA|nr:ORF29 [Felis catus gammaherpesvirus 1]ALE14741.1 ORF29 [Felis catus gammaherpesvirus 1]